MANILFSSYSPNLSIFLKQIIIREIKFGKIFLNLTQIPFIEYKHILMLLTNLSAITKLLSGSHSQTTYVVNQYHLIIIMQACFLERSDRIRNKTPIHTTLIANLSYYKHGESIRLQQ